MKIPTIPHGYLCDRRSLPLWSAALAVVLTLMPPALAGPRGGAPGLPVGHFELVATYESGSVAEIVDATPNGNLLVYTDSEGKQVGFVDITDPANPIGVGTLPVGGEPTSVAITPNGLYALVCVHGDPDKLLVLDLLNMENGSVAIPLGGQPDCVAISSDGRYAAITIENERDEDLNDGEMPQDPPGFLTIVDLVGTPDTWATRAVDLRGLALRFPDDPEPEYVAINPDNVAAVTLQENNHVVLVHLPTGLIVGHFSAGTTTHAADLVKDGQVLFADTLKDARLEPDAIGWTPGGNLVTANEGDYDLDLAEGEFVGGRNFTIFTPDGKLLFDCGAQLELAAAAAGLYDDKRSNSKGVEPEGIEIARYLNHTFLFVGMERAKSVAVYRLDNDQAVPQFVQLLATGKRPEGLLAIPQRALFVSANEDDGTISIFAGKPGNP